MGRVSDAGTCSGTAWAEVAEDVALKLLGRAEEHLSNDPRLKIGEHEELGLSAMADVGSIAAQLAHVAAELCHAAEVRLLRERVDLLLEALGVSWDREGVSVDMPEPVETVTVETDEEDVADDASGRRPPLGRSG